MKLLQDRIRREGRVLPGNIVKVDGFLNHRVDTALLSQIADEFAKIFDIKDITVRHRPGHYLRPEVRCAYDLCQESQERQH